MERLDTLLSAATLLLIPVLAFIGRIGRDGLEAGVKASAEEGARTAVKNINWPKELAQELEKARGLERQELRLQSYGALWARLRPLAIYDDSRLDTEAVRALGKELTGWYFSPAGGLMLTPQVRAFYFALQDLLHALGAAGPWEAERHPGALSDAFREILVSSGLERAAKVLAFLDEATSAAWFSDGASQAEVWRREVPELCRRWGRTSPQDRFTILQQMGSVLRTALTKDIDSRSN